MIPARSAHAPALAAIHAGAYPPDEAWPAAAFAAQLRLPGTFGLIDLAGGLILARVAADEAEILTLAVHPDARRRGIARMLLEAAVAGAAAMGAAAMFLEVSEINHAARSLYETSGFHPAGRRRRYYPDGSDALVMRRDITCGAAADG
jgi:ribosomal-protein-alanine N-acetyltransferase